MRIKQSSVLLHHHNNCPVPVLSLLSLLANNLSLLMKWNLRRKLLRGRLLSYFCGEYWLRAEGEAAGNVTDKTVICNYRAVWSGGGHWTPVITLQPSSDWVWLHSIDAMIGWHLARPTLEAAEQPSVHGLTSLYTSVLLLSADIEILSTIFYKSLSNIYFFLRGDNLGS